jgi:vacuolar-type H+-ATPase subunit H
MRKNMRSRRDVREDGATLTEDEDARSPDVVDYEELGEHVASVLKAAELAAQEIRTRAENEAMAQVSEAGRQAGTMLHEAEGLRAETEEANRAMREQAESYAEKTRRDADAEASNVLQAAEQAVVTRASDDEARQTALHEDIERTERRLTELVSGLRDLAERLEELVSADQPDADEVDQRSGGDDASLDASLMASIGAETTDATS